MTVHCSPTLSTENARNLTRTAPNAACIPLYQPVPALKLPAHKLHAAVHPSISDRCTAVNLSSAPFTPPDPLDKPVRSPIKPKPLPFPLLTQRSDVTVDSPRVKPTMRTPVATVSTSDESNVVGLLLGCLLGATVCKAVVIMLLFVTQTDTYTMTSSVTGVSLLSALFLLCAYFLYRNQHIHDSSSVRIQPSNGDENVHDIADIEQGERSLFEKPAAVAPGRARDNLLKTILRVYCVLCIAAASVLLLLLLLQPSDNTTQYAMFALVATLLVAALVTCWFDMHCQIRCTIVGVFSKCRAPRVQCFSCSSCMKVLQQCMFVLSTFVYSACMCCGSTLYCVKWCRWRRSSRLHAEIRTVIPVPCQESPSKYNSNINDMVLFNISINDSCAQNHVNNVTTVHNNNLMSAEEGREGHRHGNEYKWHGYGKNHTFANRALHHEPSFMNVCTVPSAPSKAWARTLRRTSFAGKVQKVRAPPKLQTLRYSSKGSVTVLKAPSERFKLRWGKSNKKVYAL